MSTCLQYRSHQDVFREGDLVDAIMVLRQGWAYRYRLLDDGGCHILRFLMSGDMISPFSPCAGHFVASMSHAVVAIIRPRTSAVASQDMLNLEAAVTRALVEEYKDLSEHAITLAKRGAVEGVAFLLLQLYHRACRAGLANGKSYAFPATQGMIAHALGLTRIHVNRTLYRLRNENIASVSGGRVTIIDEERMATIAQRPTLQSAADGPSPRFVRVRDLALFPV